MLPQLYWVKISQIRTFSVDRLGKKVRSPETGTLAQSVDGLLEPVGQEIRLSPGQLGGILSRTRGREMSVSRSAGPS